MKSILCFSIILLISTMVFAQNGVYQSTRFEFISENDPAKNREEFSNKTIIFQINELQGEFVDGKVLWEMTKDGQSEYIEWELISLKNSFYDEKTNAFIKSYKSNMKILGKVIRPAEIYISKFVKENKYRVDVYDPEMKTINRFDNLIKK